MDEAFLESLARAAGLDVALIQFRADVLAAGRQAEALRATLRRHALPPLAPGDEPWPPMQVDDRR